MTALAQRFPSGHIPQVEEIQDQVEESLILLDFPKTAKAYILYRHERAKIRDKVKDVPEHVKKLAAESKQYFRNPLAEFVYYRTYSRWIDDESRRETWIETVDRYLSFMREKLGEKLTEAEYTELRTAILSQQIMPSMRLMWSAGSGAQQQCRGLITALSSRRRGSTILPRSCFCSCAGGVGFRSRAKTCNCCLLFSARAAT